LRVGIIAACPFPADHGTPGGIREKAEALVELGHDVHVITYAAHQPGEVRGVTIHRIAPVGPVHDIKVGPSKAKLLWDVQLVFKTIQVILRERLDVIHGINYEGAMIGCLAKWATGRPLVYGAVNTMIDELDSYKFIWPPKLARVLARILDWAVPRLADRAVCYTDTIHRFLLRAGVPADRVDIVKLGIDLSMFRNAAPAGARRSMNVNGDPLIVYTGVLNKFQRVDYLLQAMRVVRASVPTAKLAFVRTLDDEPQRREVEEMAEEEGVRDMVLFPPVIPFEQLPPYLAAADATAIPRPDCPGIPVKLINFMAAGRPVVVARGSSQGLRDGHEVLVVDDHDPVAMGHALVRVLQDKELAARLGRQAREAAYAEYDRQATTRVLVDVYRKALAGRGRVPQAAVVATVRA
jgi:1,2-diacylglycerol 3-alpha-glucosyltransferase